MIPLIGSICQGPLGISQLPRTWWKAITRQVGLLDETYPDNCGGLDAWCLDALELAVDETYAYLDDELPDYVTFEQWVVDRKNGAFSKARIERFNLMLQRRVHSRPHKITETYGDIGYDPETHTEVGALLLNTLQDWSLFRDRDYASGDIPQGIPPLISSLDVGPLKVVQLARTWHKVLLDAKGLLNEDYPACGSGLDQRVLDALGLGRDNTLAYLTESLPSYLAFQAWVTEQIGEVDREGVEEFRQRMLTRKHPDPKLSGIHDLTGCDRSITNGRLLNHVEDWRYAYDVLIKKM
ncbi:MAG: hypothetical protein CME19_23190 [Gemmatimonadetes bacterium]|nr:hypothetical protein [Gemmatimonadota bacterium]|tara:strand:+ start:1069 stop:1953 length:885 start_codon:yes stop_codon:yes gene_type:complete